MSERTPAKAERNAAIVERRLAGVSVKRLAREFAICPQRVKQLTAGIGVPPRMAGRPVMVGGVIFDTVTAAARAAGISQGEGSKRAARGRKGWRFLGPITMALALAACCGGAEAQERMPCAKLAAVTAGLAEQFGEKPVAAGLQADGRMLEIFASPDGATWTAVAISPARVACVVATGRGWQQDAAGDPS
jgi:hypothetical protein